MAGSHPTKLRKALVVGGMATWAFAFIGFFGTHATTFEDGLRLAASIIFGVPVVLTALVFVVTKQHPLDLPLGFLLVSYGVVSVLSADRTASLETVPLVVAYASVFVISARGVPDTVAEGLAIGTCLAATVWLAFFALLWTSGIVAVVADTGAFPALVGRSGNLWLSTDAVAAMALVAAPHYLLIQRSSFRRVLLLISGVAALVVIPLSGGRSAWAAIIIAIGVFWLVRPDRMRALDTRKVLLVWVAGIGAAATLTAVAMIGSGMLGTLSGRMFVWRTAVAVAESHPFVGSGPGTFSWVRLAESPELLNRFPVYHAHNLVLQLLADGGMLLLIGFSAFVIAYARGVLDGTNPLTRPARVALASVVGFGLILMMDELTQLPALTVMAIYSAGVVVRRPSLRRQSTGLRPAGLVLAATVVVMLFVAMPATFAAHAARVSAGNGRDLAISGDWSGARQAFSFAATAWPARASYHLSLGLARAQLGETDGARTSYEAAHRLSPGDPRALGGLASVGRDSAERIGFLQTASRLGIQDPQYSLRLATELIARGDRMGATREWARAALLDPQLLAVPQLEELGLNVEEVVDALDAVVQDEARLLGIDGDVALKQGELATNRVPPNDPVLKAIGLAMSGQVAAADRDLNDLITRNPLDRRARQVAVAIARLECRGADAARHERMLGLIGGGSLELYAPVGPSAESFDQIYRELGLGDYQPSWVPDLPALRSDWPAGFLPSPRCE